MTKNEILNMPAGREMDILVAEKVMGWTRKYVGEFGNQIWDSPSQGAYLEDAIPNYSTDIASAWEVVEKMKEEGFQFVIGTSELFGKPVRYFVEFKKEGTAFSHNRVYTDTVPLAVCRAAMLPALPERSVTGSAREVHRER